MLPAERLRIPLVAAKEKLVGVNTSLVVGNDVWSHAHMTKVEFQRIRQIVSDGEAYALVSPYAGGPRHARTCEWSPSRAVTSLAHPLASSRRATPPCAGLHTPCHACPPMGAQACSHTHLRTRTLALSGGSCALWCMYMIFSTAPVEVPIWAKGVADQAGTFEGRQGAKDRAGDREWCPRRAPAESLTDEEASRGAAAAEVKVVDFLQGQGLLREVPMHEAVGASPVWKCEEGPLLDTFLNFSAFAR
jgi:hypothetical protein